MSATPRLTVVALSEDSGQQGWSAVHRLVRHTLDLLVEGMDWQEGVQVVPRAEVPVYVQQVCAGNAWRSTRAADHPRRGQLFRYVAQQLDAGRDHPQWVMFHVDADRRWSQRRTHPSDNLRQFEDIVRVGVKAALLAGRAPPDEATAAQLMTRLLVIPPYYAIEAWLYQATGRARALCQQRPCQGAHRATYDAWEANRAALDAWDNPKDRAGPAGPHCLTDDDKDTLARNFPAQEVWSAAQSYAAWVDGLLADEALINALKQAQHTAG